MSSIRHTKRNSGTVVSSAATFGNQNHTTTTNTTTNDPMAQLARGYIARFVNKPLQPLAPDEIEKDLRHFQAYRTAVISYRQQYYMAVNRNNSSNNNNNLTTHAAASEPKFDAPSEYHHATTAPPFLPVRIDPEEEKRAALLRKKIRRAECLREEAEQHYVALRSHYVHAAHESVAANQERRFVLEWLRSKVVARARAVALLRATLQMTRDVANVLQYRADKLGAHVGQITAGIQENNNMMEEDNNKNNNNNNNNDAQNTTNEDDLMTVWNQAQEDLKQATTKKGTKKPMSWPCIKEPSTPRNVPLLLSSLAHPTAAPEKSIAFATNGAFGAKPYSLCWLVNHLTEPVDESVDEDASPEEQQQQQPKREQLRDEADVLQQELDRERHDNEVLSGKIAVARLKNDEWVAMICLVRQETEAVLFRHNILLESEQAQAAAEAKYRESELAKANNGDAMGGAETQSGGGDHGEESADKNLDDRPVDEANDGDDEGSNNEEEEVEWGGNKRPVETVQEDGSTRKKARRTE
jgi:hypothetical protein